MHCECERETCIHKNEEKELGKEGKINTERHECMEIFPGVFQ